MRPRDSWGFSESLIVRDATTSGCAQNPKVQALPSFFVSLGLSATAAQVAGALAAVPPATVGPFKAGRAT